MKKYSNNLNFSLTCEDNSVNLYEYAAQRGRSLSIFRWDSTEAGE